MLAKLQNIFFDSFSMDKLKIYTCLNKKMLNNGFLAFLFSFSPLPLILLFLNTTEHRAGPMHVPSMFWSQMQAIRNQIGYLM